MWAGYLAAFQRKTFFFISSIIIFPAPVYFEMHGFNYTVLLVINLFCNKDYFIFDIQYWWPFTLAIVEDGHIDF